MTDIPPPADTSSASAKKPRAPFSTFLPLIGVIVIMLAYTAYWFAVSGTFRDRIEAFAAESRGGDVLAEWTTLSMEGYPYRIAAAFTAPHVTAPRTPENWSWTAAGLEADVMPYNLRHIVLKVDGEQILQYNDTRGPAPLRHTIHAKAEGTWASYVAIKGVPFGRLAIDVNKLVARHDGGTGLDPTSQGEHLTAERLQLHVRPAEDTNASGITLPGSYDFALQGNNVAVSAIGPAQVLGTHIELFTMQARLRDVTDEKSASPARLAKAWMRDGGRLTVSDLQIKWGPLDLWAQGNLALDDEARPAGNLDAEIRDYPALVQALVNQGIIRAQDAKIAQVGLGLVAQMQGKNDGAIAVPVVMKDGKLFLGPLVVARLDPLF
tara:strand:+ start:137934 stop:139070 length:1137 start_codon:yes stop_codon:yes gene_type:complete